MFSRRMVLNLEEVVQSKVRKLIGLTANGLAQGTPVRYTSYVRSHSCEFVY